MKFDDWEDDEETGYGEDVDEEEESDVDYALAKEVENMDSKMLNGKNEQGERKLYRLWLNCLMYLKGKMLRVI